MKAADFKGAGILMSHFARRDRLVLPLWVLTPLALLLLNAATFAAMDGRGQGLGAALSSFNGDPLISTVLGPVMSIDLPGALVWRAVSLLALALGLGSLFSVIRHTRMDEEAGRGELIRAYAVGRYATLTASLAVTILGDLAAGALIALGMLCLGGGAAGSLLFGATLSALGCFFAGVGALGAQLRDTGGGARGIGIAALGCGILLAILNNAGGGQTALSWATPMAWQRLIRPFAGDRAGYLAYFAAFSAVPIVLAYLLCPTRDLGAGLFPPRPGPREAAPGLSSPLALAWRLQRRNFYGWLIGTTLYIAVFAGISPVLSGAGGASEWLSTLGGADWTAGAGLGYVFVSVGVYLIALIVAVYAMGAVLRLKKEESDGQVEAILDKGVSRARYMGGHAIIAAAGSAALLSALGLVGGAVYGAVSGDSIQGFWRVFAMGASKIPAVWTLVGLAALLYGAFPRMAPAVWPIWLGCTLLEVAWEARIIGWPLMRLSPFSYAHYTIDLKELPLAALLCLVGLALALCALGLWGFGRRDIMTKA